MIKLLNKLEKSRTCWYLIAITILFFTLRLPSLMEPNWYGDEGFYQVIGMALNNGHLLYSEIWDNKPPLLYVTYALFHGDQFFIRLASLFVGLLATWLFYSLAKKLFKKFQASIVATVIFTLFFATPLIEGNIANAENFMLLPIIIAGLLLYHLSEKNTSQHTSQRATLFLAGLFLGIAFLFKIVALFDFVAFFFFLILLALPEKWRATVPVMKKTLQHMLRYVLPYLLGFFIPLLVTILYFAMQHTLPAFIQATFFGNIGYVGYGNKLLIPQGFLILKALLLVGIICGLILRHKHFSRPTLFILIWLVFSLFNAFFSQRPYTHYLLVLLPSFCLTVGLLLNATTRKIKLRFFLLLIVVIGIIFSTFKVYSLKKTALYYQNALLFATGKKDVTSYQDFFDHKTPRDYQVATFIKMHTKPNDKIFIWGDNPQIYALSQTLPINKYPVAYHIRQSKSGLKDTQEALNRIQPKYVIILYEAPSFPFLIDTYTKTYSLDRATIYERTF